ncbi:MAG: DUF86 domain-containing protein [Nitriliruptorales bacterium]|nr:DUF86 domain-containing protein [Nitriliruptorales bacterium]
MGEIRGGFERLLAAAADGRLSDACKRHDVHVLGACGDATKDDLRPGQRSDLDLAVAFHDRRHRDLLELVQELSALSGCDRIDLLDLHRADPLAREEGLRGIPLYESESGAYARALMIAAQGRLDTVWLRRLQQEHAGRTIPESFDPTLVRTRLAEIRDLLDDLRQLLPIGAERLTRDRLSRRALERILLHLIQVTVNNNAYTAVALTGTAPRSHHASFAAVSGTGMIEQALADDLAPSAGLRMMLVHDPAGVEPERLYMMGMRMLECYDHYLRQATAFIDARDRAVSQRG